MAVKALVTGANGFVGHHLCDYLRAQGRDVVAAVRQTGGENQLVVGAIDAQTDWSAALEGVDVVIHTAARVHVLHESASDPISVFRTINVDGVMNLARQAEQLGVRRLVFLSTIGVLGNYSDHPLTESDTTVPSNAYSTSKWEAEQQLREFSQSNELEVVIIRPPLVYGPGVKANFYRLMEWVASEKPLPFGLVRNARDFVSVTNLCSLIDVCLEHPAAVDETFLAADGQAISTPDLVRRLAAWLGCSPRLIPVPTILLRLGACLLQKERLYHSVCRSLRVDISKAQQVLGWQPPQAMEDGLQQTVDWFASQRTKEKR